MSLLLGWVIFVAALLISIMLHEAGHFATAKKFRMKVTQFFVGFGQTLWSRTKGETEYGVKALPFGGFVKITGMTALEDVDPADEPRSFRRQPGWQRLIVLGAGSFMHFALAFVLLIVLAVGIGLASDNSTKIGTVSACIPATVTAFDNGTCTKGSRAVARPRRPGSGTATRSSPSAAPGCATGRSSARPSGRSRSASRSPSPCCATGKQLVLHAVPAQISGRHGSYLGIGNAATFQRLSPLSAVSYAGSTFGQVLSGSVTAVGHLPAAIPDLFAKDRARTPAGQVSSVVGVGGITAQVVAAKDSWKIKVAYVLLIIISLNIFVGAFNLLPLLPLDGGHIAVVIYERVRAWLARLRGLPDPGLVDMRKLVPVSVGVFAVLVGFGLLLITADIFNPIHIVQ